MRKSLKLTVGTVTERIGDESMTRSDSAFVHRNIWQRLFLLPPYAESALHRIGPFASSPLTFATTALGPARRARSSLFDIHDLLIIPNTSLMQTGVFYRLRLTFGTRAERTDDESPTWSCWLFVLHNIWFSQRVTATNYESPGQHHDPSKLSLLTFDAATWPRPPFAVGARPPGSASPVIHELLGIPNTWLIDLSVFEQSR